MALNVVLTNSGSTWAFFGLPARAWEFAVAGLLAAVRVPDLLRSVAARTALAVGGVVVLLVALVVIDDRTPYPGLWALLPVTATVLLIVAGETWGATVAVAPLTRVLSLKPLQWMGRVSYSWYLWHWPAIVLTAVALDRDTVRVKSAAALASLPVAWLAYRFFETPLRFAPVIARSSRRTFVVGGAVTVAVVLLAFAVWPGQTATPSIDTTDIAQLEAPPGSSLEERVNFAVQLYRDRVDVECPVNSIKTDEGDDYCVGGDASSDRTLLLLGDSHAGQWRRTLEAIAKERHIKLLVREHSGCPAYDVVTKGRNGQGVSEVCKLAHASDLRIIDAMAPDAVLIVGWSGYEDGVLEADGTEPDADGKEQIWYQAASSLLGLLRSKGIPTGEILDEPTLPSDMSKCLVKEGDVDRCAVPLDKAMAASMRLLRAERKAIDEVGGIATLDMASLVCDATRCPAEIDGTLVFVDRHHLTDAFAMTQRPSVDRLVGQLLP